jgi:hypothetical protein
MILSFITGGLANQMFQLSASLSVSKNEAIKLIWGTGASLNSESDFPEVMDFKLPANVSCLTPRSMGKPLQKLMNFLLVRGARNVPRTIVFFGIKFFLEIYFTIRLKDSCKVLVSQGLGFYPIEKKSKNLVLIGYFQSYRYTSDAKDWFGTEILKTKVGKKLDELGVGNLKEQTYVAVHVRLGDYRKELNFGILTNKYYHNVISKLSIQETELVVVFSDEPENCLSRIPEVLREKTWIVPPAVFTSAETLVLMSKATAFVIANSTFSWWGARLGDQHSATVFAPNPWFKTNEVPNDLYLPEWILNEAYFCLKEHSVPGDQ